MNVPDAISVNELRVYFRALINNSLHVSQKLEQPRDGATSSSKLHDTNSRSLGKNRQDGDRNVLWLSKLLMQ